MSTFIGAPPAVPVAKVVDTVLTAVPCTGVGAGAANLVKSFTLPSLHGANSNYDLILRYTLTGVTQASFIVRIKSGANTADITIRADDGAANGTCALTAKIYPLSTVSVEMDSIVIRDGNVPNAVSYRAQNVTPGGATTWAQQTAIEVLGWVSVAGTLSVTGAALNWIGQ